MLKIWKNRQTFETTKKKKKIKKIEIIISIVVTEGKKKKSEFYKGFFLVEKLEKFRHILRQKKELELARFRQ
jgi:hypothetical protein